MSPEEYEERKRKSNEYYKANKDKINQKKECDICGKNINWKNRNIHYMTKKCQAKKNE